MFCGGTQEKDEKTICKVKSKKKRIKWKEYENYYFNVTSEKYLAPLFNKIARQCKKQEFGNSLINFSLCIFRSKLLSHLLPFHIVYVKAIKLQL